MYQQFPSLLLPLILLASGFNKQPRKRCIIQCLRLRSVWFQLSRICGSSVSFAGRVLCRTRCWRLAGTWCLGVCAALFGLLLQAILRPSSQSRLWKAEVPPECSVVSSLSCEGWRFVMFAHRCATHLTMESSQLNWKCAMMSMSPLVRLPGYAFWPYSSLLDDWKISLHSASICCDYPCIKHVFLFWGLCWLGPCR